MAEARPKLILASRSPRRRQLLTEAGYDFVIMPASESAECGTCSRESPAELVARFALQKATEVAGRIEAGLILACDTVAECDGQVLGKPPSIELAERMLRMLSGREHRVLSGLCLWKLPDRPPMLEVAVTRLRMDGLSEQQLADYLESGRWEGKAGAFGYQDGNDWLHIIEGSPSNVVGLPMELLAKMISALNGRDS